MSDGPHRSLPMRRAWKKVAEQADNKNYKIPKLADMLSHALVEDFRKEVPVDVVRLVKEQFLGRGNDLFPDQKGHDLANIQRLVNGYPMAGTLLDCATQELRAGNLGPQGLADTVKVTLYERSLAARRDVEEHYRRHPESSQARAAKVRDRMTIALQNAPFEVAAQYALRNEAFPRQKGSQHGGLDEGPDI